jgi:WD40 repeat protein
VIVRVSVLIVILSLHLSQAADEPRLVLDTGGHQGLVEGLAFTPDGNSVVTGGDDKVVRVWDWRTGGAVRLIRGQVSEGPQGTI